MLYFLRNRGMNVKFHHFFIKLCVLVEPRFNKNAALPFYIHGFEALIKGKPSQKSLSLHATFIAQVADNRAGSSRE